MLTNRLAELIARSLSKEASPEELEELEGYMRSHPEDQYFRDILISYWNSQKESSPEDDSASDQHFKYILALADEQRETNMPYQEDSREIPANDKEEPSLDVTEIGSLSGTKKIPWIKWAGAAAVVAGIIIATVLLIPGRENPSIPERPLQNEVIAKKGARTMLVLPDGSHVWLNSETKLLYPEKFADGLREVKLEGEAYFDIVKDSGRPFIVHTSGIDIHVLGTVFNVKSYADEPTIETTLISGRVEIVQTMHPGIRRDVLVPHQKAVYFKTKEKMVMEKKTSPPINNISSNAAIQVLALPEHIADTSIRETSWVYNKLVFDDEKFNEISARMERWYNVKINFKNEKVANARLHGSFIGEPVEKALDALKLIVRFTYKKTGDQIDIDK